MQTDKGNYRAEVLAEYAVDQNGIIRSPGKFELEMIYAPYFWQMALDGCADDDDGELFTFEIGDQEREQFPELMDVTKVVLRENEQGFVSCTTHRK